MAYETILVEVKGKVGVITLNRPQALNALNGQLIGEVNAALDGFERDPGIGCTVITGSEKAFAAGADIKEMQDRTYPGTYLDDKFADWDRIGQRRKPIIAAVAGFALGGGCELAMACDVILASENASFGQPEVALGLIPGFGGSVRLPRYVGAAAARELILTGRRIDAAEAAQLGLVSRILPDHGKLIEAAHEMIDLSAGQSPVAVAAAKRVLREAGSLSIDAGLEVERAAFAACFDTADMAEGTAAFVEKRRPEFPGR